MYIADDTHHRRQHYPRTRNSVPNSNPNPNPNPNPIKPVYRSPPSHAPAAPSHTSASPFSPGTHSPPPPSSTDYSDPFLPQTPDPVPAPTAAPYSQPQSSYSNPKFEAHGGYQPSSHPQLPTSRSSYDRSAPNYNPNPNSNPGSPNSCYPPYDNRVMDFSRRRSDMGPEVHGKRAENGFRDNGIDSLCRNNEGVYAYRGSGEPYGRPIRHSSSSPGKERSSISGLKAVKAVPKSDTQQDAKSGVRKIRVKFSAGSGGQSATGVLCQLQNQELNAKEQIKKDNRREMKENRKGKKGKKSYQNLENSDIVKGDTTENLWSNAKIQHFNKGSKIELVQLERSSLTEEHEKPACLFVPSTSSNSTADSSNRKRNSSPGDVSRGPRNIVRIRLPSKNQNQSDASANGQPCSTSGRTSFPSQAKGDTDFNLGTRCCTTQLASDNIEQSLALKIDIQRRCSSAKQTVETPIPPAVDAVMTLTKRDEFVYKNIIEHWVPPQLQSGYLDSDDQDWLFPSNEVPQPKKRQICSGDSISSCYGRSSVSWPAATYLPEVAVYALPYMVPF